MHGKSGDRFNDTTQSPFLRLRGLDFSDDEDNEQLLDMLMSENGLSDDEAPPYVPLRNEDGTQFNEQMRQIDEQDFARPP